MPYMVNAGLILQGSLDEFQTMERANKLTETHKAQLVDVIQRKRKSDSLRPTYRARIGDLGGTALRISGRAGRGAIGAI